MKNCSFPSRHRLLVRRANRRARAIAHQRRGRNLPVSNLFEVVRRIREGARRILYVCVRQNDDKELDFLARGKVQIVTPRGPTEMQAAVKVRRGQQFFRQTVLNSYDVRCCISGINVPRLLMASHIKPWGKFPAERLNPRNGLCLSTLHDAAFDGGLITLDKNLKVKCR